MLGEICVGECVCVLLFGKESCVVLVIMLVGEVGIVCVGEVVMFMFVDEIDISCGDLIVCVDVLLEVVD